MLSWKDIAVLAFAFALWRFLVYFGRTSPLDEIKRPPGGEFLTGHLNVIFDDKGWLTYTEHLSDEYGGVVKLKGLMGDDDLWVTDPRALEHMFLKTSSAWDVSPYFANGISLLFGPSLPTTIGAQHKKQRRLLNPVFSTTQLSTVVPLFYNIGRQLRQKLLMEVGTKKAEVDLLNWMGRTTMEFVGQGILDYEFHTLDGRKSKYRDSLRLLAPTLTRTGLFEIIAPMVANVGPPWFREFIMKLIPIPAVQDLKHIVDVLHQTSTGIFYERKKRLDPDDNTTEGKDLLSRLVLANSDVTEDDRLSDQEAIAQISTLMFAANETTATALSRIFQLLAEHPDIQTKLRDEIGHANADMDMEYDRLMSLPYLDAVCKETLRLYPPVPMVSRVCQQDDILPLWEPIRTKTGRTVTEVCVPKGTTAWIGINAANRSKSIWGANAREWIPERWLTPGSIYKTSLPGVFSSMMTFFAGERGCLGYKMAVLELKIVLSVLLPTFQVEPSSKPIVWCLGEMLAPYVQGVDGKADSGPEMPLRLSRIRE